MDITESNLSTKEEVIEKKETLNWARVSRGKGDEELYNPSGIAICRLTGNIYVTDSAADRIQVFNREGYYSYSMQDTQCMPTFHYITLYKQYIIISCVNPTRIMVRTRHDGYHVTSYRLDNVTGGLDVDSLGVIFIIEMLTETVCVLENCGIVRKLKLYDNDCKNTNEEVSVSRKVGQDIKLTADQNKFYILFGMNSFYLELYDMEGNIISRLIDSDVLVWPKSFCINNTNGNILIADKSGHQIKIFNSNGKLLTEIGEKELRHASYFYTPYGIGIGFNGDVVVSNCKQNCMLLSFEVNTEK